MPSTDYKSYDKKSALEQKPGSVLEGNVTPGECAPSRLISEKEDVFGAASPEE